MAEYNDDFVAEQDGDSELVKNLRKQIAQHAAARKAAEQRVTVLETEFRGKTVAELLKENGLPERVGKYVPDTVTDKESLDEWLKGDGDIFANLRTQTTEEPTAPTGEVAQDGETEAVGLPPELAALFAQVNQTESGATPVPAGAEARLSKGLQSLRGAGPDAVAAALASGKIPVA